MAKDMLDAVCAAEEEAASREEKALEKATDTAEQAKKEAAELTRKRRKAAEQKSADELEKSKAELEQKGKAAKAEAEKACGDISALADKNRESGFFFDLKNFYLFLPSAMGLTSDFSKIIMKIIRNSMTENDKCFKQSSHIFVFS